LAEPGHPNLPMVGTLIGLPLECKPQLSVLYEQAETRVVGKIASINEGEISNVRAASNQWFPEKTVELGSEGTLRRQRVQQIRFYPVRYLEGQQLAHITRSLRLRVDFGNYPVQVGMTNLTDPYQTVYDDLIINHEQSRSWQQPDAVRSALSKTAGKPTGSVRLYVQDDDVYGVTGRELADAGLDLSEIDPRTLALTWRDEPVPMIVEGNSDGRFDFDDRIIFIGEHASGDETYRSFYSDHNVYQLSWGAQPGLGFAPLLVTPSSAASDTLDYASYTLHLEEDQRFERMVGYAGETDDHWFWQKLSNDSPFSIPFTLPHQRLDSPLQLTAAFHGLTQIKNVELDHLVQLSVDGQAIGEIGGSDNNPFLFVGKPFVTSNMTSHQLSFDLPLPPGVDVDQLFLNWVEINYHRNLQADAGELTFDLPGESDVSFRVQGFQTDQVLFLTANGYRLSGYESRSTTDGYQFLFSYPSLQATRVYAVEKKRLAVVSRLEVDELSNLREMHHQADYIVITHRDFAAAAKRIADYRQSKGLTTYIADIQDVYDEFSGGNFDPRAIRQFVQHAYFNWSKPAPTYLLLIGDATSLMDKEQGVKTPVHFHTFLPSMMVNTLSFGMTSSDNYFAAVAGDDDLPDLFVGRIPANTLEQANDIIDKIIAYESHRPTEEWRRHMTLVAGNGEFFSQAAEYVDKHHLPDWMVTHKLSTDYTSPIFHTTEDLINWINDGQSIINFLVHGAGEQIDDANLFSKDDLLRLTNADRYAFSVTMSCYIGHFDNPEKTSLGEELLSAPHKGLMALFGSAGKSYLYSDFFFNNALFDGIFRLNRRSLGEITTGAKYDLFTQTRGFNEPIRNYLLLGDPATRLQLPENTIDLKLSKNVLVEGDRLRVSGTIANGASGAIHFSALDESDSLLIDSEGQVANGRFDVEILTMTPQLRRHWGRHGGDGYIRAFFTDGNQSAVGVQPFSVIRPLLKQFTHVPIKPVSFEPVDFIVEIDPLTAQESGGIKSLQLQWSTEAEQWNELPMSLSGDGIWRSSTSLSQEEGQVVQYKLLITNESGLVTESEIHEYRVLYKPDLYTDSSPIWLNNGGDYLQLTIKNRGESDAFAVPVRIWNMTSNSAVVDQFIVPAVRARSDTTVHIPAPALQSGSYQFAVQIDPDSVISEEEKNNNQLIRPLNLITAAGGSSGVMRFFDNDVTLTLPEASVPRNVSLDIRSGATKTIEQSAVAASLILLKSQQAAGPQIYELVFADSTMKTIKPITLTMAYEKEDSTTLRLLSEHALRLYTWDEQAQLWKGLNTTHVAISSRLAASLPAGARYFAIMACTDQQPPLVRLDVEGQNFADSDVVPANPKLLISIEDNSGVD
ncbi:MAG: hypothetical protein EHM72_14335, partial [Calditrichaeota bacterium]